jgi:hypothetical protein
MGSLQRIDRRIFRRLGDDSSGRVFFSDCGYCVVIGSVGSRDQEPRPVLLTDGALSLAPAVLRTS